jgi:hypothetical protein
MWLVSWSASPRQLAWLGTNLQPLPTLARQQRVQYVQLARTKMQPTTRKCGASIVQQTSIKIWQASNIANNRQLA